MTGWIKMGVTLRTHPKVVRMASALKADKLRVIGGLFAVWCIFDAHSSEGQLEGYSFVAIDDELGWKGFAAAMGSIGWLDEIESGVTAPRFEEHNGATAKRRAVETERKTLSREKSGDVRSKSGRVTDWKGTKSGQATVQDADKQRTDNGQLSASDADSLRAREDKRREEREKKDTPPAARVPPSASPRATKRCPDSFEITPELSTWAASKVPGVAIANETEKFRDWTFKTAHSDWPAAWRSWMRKAFEDLAKAKSHATSNGNGHAGSNGRGVDRDIQALLDRDSHAPWAIKAGFEDIWTAENAGCHEWNASKFRDGRKVAT